MTSNARTDVTITITSIYRTEWGRITATLIRLVRDFDVGLYAAQEAFIAAVNQWHSTGIPDLPRA
ncbi:hypothetical protein H6G96_37695 [Nostoc sp. FACHB-892]|uniref:hypothetical protein n=1 Tax=Nostoc sp. FACHB-892 TaxID=2692843 RepID=UPI0016875A5D|nr:hypothetical protein [Nostoc sp. FACHB-892]MBD2731853.1 hypothetical protein [Nostoc sp. FACHB-892]